MSLLDDIESAPTNRRGPSCSVAILLASLEPEDAAGLAQALGNQTILGSTIAGVLRDKDYDISVETVNRHRRGACRCRTS